MRSSDFNRIVIQCNIWHTAYLLQEQCKVLLVGGNTCFLRGVTHGGLLLGGYEAGCCLQVGRAGRFGTKGLAITFVASEQDSAVLNQVQERFDVDIKPLPDNVEPSTYMNVA